MSCCGHRRAALGSGALRPAPPAPAHIEPVSVQRLIYGGPVPMVLAGPVSQCIYELYEANGAVAVDPRDAEALLQTAWFT